MSKYFSVDGFWNDDKSEFEGYIIKEFHDEELYSALDDKIFYYGLSELQIKDMIKNPNKNEEFTITDYKQIEFP